MNPGRCYICQAKLIKGGNENVPADKSRLLDYCRAIVKDNLKDTRPGRRQLAVSCLPLVLGKAAREKLIQFLHDKSVQVQVQAAVALGNLRDRKSLPVVRSAIQVENLDPFNCTSFWGALYKLGDNSAFSSLKKALVDADVNTRCWAIEQIAPLEEKDLYVTLRERLAESDPTYERIDLLGALGRLGDKDAAKKLESYLQAEALGQRELAARYISDIKGEDKVIVPILTRMLHHPDLRVRIYAAAGMKRRGREQFVEIIVDALRSDDLAAAVYACQLLQELGEERHIPSLVPFLRTSAKLDFAVVIASIIRRGEGIKNSDSKK